MACIRIDPLGRTNSFAYDMAGRTIKRSFPGEFVAAFEYDAQGNSTSIAPPGRPPHRFEYSLVDLPVRYSPPSIGGATNSLAMFYDLDRHMTGMRLADGRVLTNRYDIGGRLSLQQFSGETRQFTYYTNGLTASIQTADVTVSNTYDGHLLTSVGWSGSINGRVDWAYDADFRIRNLVVDTNFSVPFAYDADGLVTNAGALALQWNATNKLLQGTALGNINDSWQYNSHGMPVAYAARFNDGIVVQFEYTYDAADRLIQRRETIGGTTSSWAYRYDLAGRLIGVDKDGSLYGQYTYDSNGNRLTSRQAISNGNQTLTGVFNDADLLQTLTMGNSGSVVKFAYTANGELAARSFDAQSTSYDYDPLGNLRTVILPDGRRVRYMVDGANRRVGKSVDGILQCAFLFSGNLKPVAQLDGNNQLVCFFVYGSRDNIPDYLVKHGVTYRILCDHLCSPRLVVNAQTGELAQRIDYDEFGRVLLDTNPGFQPFGFTGGLYDPETGLVRLGARDYDAETGRWTTRDPMLFGGNDYNLYAYVRNDPINSKDVTGLGPAGQLLPPVALNALNVVSQHPNPAVATPASFWGFFNTTSQWSQGTKPGYEVVHDAAGVMANAFGFHPAVAWVPLVVTMVDYSSQTMFTAMMQHYYNAASDPVDVQSVENSYYHPGFSGLK